ncbi:MAG: polymer-forming cytoskeletal protein [Deltaproteobacteria bacterium]|nr:polymer-forming cytoskeletal protein [Deltaproteobacteria bacterium]
MAQQTSIIAAGTVIRGRISAEGDLEIHGHVEGSVEVGGTVTIGTEGLVKSDVTAQAVLVAGAVAGNLRGSERVVLEDGARVVGDLSAPSIGIRPGAKLRGRVATGEAELPRGRAAEASKPRATGDTPAARNPAARNPAARNPEPARAAAVIRPAARTPEAPAVRSAAPARTAPQASVAPVTRPTGATRAAPTREPGKAAEAPTAKRPPEPVVPVLQKRTKKAVKRRAR